MHTLFIWSHVFISAYLKHSDLRLHSTHSLLKDVRDGMFFLFFFFVLRLVRLARPLEDTLSNA